MLNIVWTGVNSKVNRGKYQVLTFFLICIFLNGALITALLHEPHLKHHITNNTASDKQNRHWCVEVGKWPQNLLTNDKGDDKGDELEKDHSDNHRISEGKAVKEDNKEYERDDKDEEKNDKDRRICSDKADKGHNKGEDGGDRGASRKPRWENFFHQICS